MKNGLFGLIACCTFILWNDCHATQISSQHAIVIRDDTGEILLGKSQDAIVPIASLTKLMTAMVVLDSRPDMEEAISIQAADVDVLKHSRSHVPVGTTLARKEIFRLALMSSDNRAAASLARTYPGSNAAFNHAMAVKIKALGLLHTVIKEPTGLSPANTSTAADLAKMAVAASKYPEIVNITTERSELIKMNGRNIAVHNTNRLVGAPGWNVLLSKTGFTNEAGHCLVMRIQQAGIRATLVLLNARADSSRIYDALSIKRLLATIDVVRRNSRYETRSLIH